MGQFPNDYSAVTASSIDGTEEVLIDDGGTKYILTSELKKALNRVEVNTQTDSYTLVLTDEGKVVRMNKATANTLTVPPNSSVAFAIGTQIVVRQHGAGTTTIAEGSGVTIHASDLEIPDRYAAAVLVKIGTDEWDLFMGGASSSTPDVTAPTIVSRTTTDATNIQVVFSEAVTLTNVGHSFKINGSNLPISAISGSGTNTIDFTVGTIADGDVLLHSYDSTTGDTVDAATNELVSFTDQSVTNTIGDVTAPELVSATVEDADPDKVVFVYDEALNASFVPANGDYSFSPAKTVTNVAVVGDTVTVTVSVPFASGDTITANYTGTSSPDPLQDAAGNQAADLTAEPVTNNVAAATTYIAFTSASSPNNVTESPTGTWTTAGAGNGYAVATSESLATSANGHIEAQYLSAANVGAVIGLDAVNSATDYDQMDYGLYVSAGTYRRIVAGTITDTAVAVTTGDHYRLARSGGDTIKAEKSPDGTTWTTIYTFPATTTAELFPKFTIVVNGNDISEVKGLGLT